MTPEERMRQAGVNSGTDKISVHQYHEYFPLEIDMLRRKIKGGMIEIGYGEGQSMGLWQQYLPNLFLYGIDIRHEGSGEMYQWIRGDQSCLADLEALNALIDRRRHPIWFINDDGSHIPEHQLLTMDYLFLNVLEEGGVYIIEDIETSYWSRGGLYGYDTRYGYLHPDSLVEKFKRLVDYVNLDLIKTEDQQHLDEQTSYLSKATKDAIASIRFGRNCIMIRKKNQNQSVSRPTGFVDYL
jgi:hypothetical protein